jgi:PHD/YefM family antitoxin component YafN of YafNO toxin-antitoxin module
LFLLANSVLLERNNVVTYLHGNVVNLGSQVMKVITSREFNQDVSQAKRAARVAPVFITDRGKATHVLMSVEAYRKLAGQTETIVDLLAMPRLPPIDLEGVRAPDVWVAKGVD